MASADELRAQLAVAELEERLAAGKDGDGPVDQLKHELRYARWVARGGPAEEQARLDNDEDHTNRAVAGHYERWSTEQGDRS